MPLIYTGQLSGNHHRLEFFEKDCIDRVENAPQYAMYQNLNELRKSNKALWSPELGAKMLRLPADNEQIFACVRPLENGKNTVIAVMNMSADEQTVTLDLTGYEGTYTAFNCGEQKNLSATETMTLKPWDYRILTK